MKMATQDRAILEELDAILRLNEVRAQIEPIVERVRAQLRASHQAPARPMAWEPIPLSIYPSPLPAGIGSSWVFILRAGTNTGAERHPNSHQRMMSWEGSGDMQTEKSAADTAATTAKTIKWRSNVLVSDPGAPLERRWISIPQNVWHQPVVSKDIDWVVVSFHTVPAEELIEERPGEDGVSRTAQMRYLG